MNPLASALNIIKRFEGIMDGDPSTVNLDPYLDPVGIWTIGWGHVVRDAQGKMIEGKDRKADARAIYPEGITMAEAEVLLRDDVRSFVAGLRKLVKPHIPDCQWAALISFSFNVGLANLRKSTLLRLLNRGLPEDAAKEFPKWTKAKGQTLNGLVRRRAVEQAVFRGHNA